MEAIVSFLNGKNGLDFFTGAVSGFSLSLEVPRAKPNNTVVDCCVMI